MPSQDEIMKQILELVSQGMGMPLTAELESVLRERYFDWIIRRKDGVPTSPQEIWDEEAGARIKERLREIGRRLAKQQQQESPVGEDYYHQVCQAVESESECPHCPEPTGG